MKYEAHMMCDILLNRFTISIVSWCSAARNGGTGSGAEGGISDDIAAAPPLFVLRRTKTLHPNIAAQMDGKLKGRLWWRSCFYSRSETTEARLNISPQSPVYGGGDRWLLAPVVSSTMAPAGSGAMVSAGAGRRSDVKCRLAPRLSRLATLGNRPFDSPAGARCHLRLFLWCSDLQLTTPTN